MAISKLGLPFIIFDKFLKKKTLSEESVGQGILSPVMLMVQI